MVLGQPTGHVHSGPAQLGSSSNRGAGRFTSDGTGCASSAATSGAAFEHSGADHTAVHRSHPNPAGCPGLGQPDRGSTRLRYPCRPCLGGTGPGS
jgi:hypothetical protein